MPKRENQTQNPIRSTKSQRCRRDQEPTTSTDPSSDLSEGHSKNPSADISEIQVTAPPSVNSSTELGAKISADNSKDLSSVPSKHSTKDLSTDLVKGSATYSSQDLPKDRSTDRRVNSSENSSPGAGEVMYFPMTDPFLHPGRTEYPDGTPKTISLTATNVESFKKHPIFTWFQGMNPEVREIIVLATMYTQEVSIFATFMINHDCDNEKIVNADEIDRIQHVFDEFGQLDPKFPVAIVAERLGKPDLRISTLEYIIHWAIITNIAVDGDPKYTLLPLDILAVYRNLDQHSSDMHRNLFARWVQLTFGLIIGGHSKHQASAETGQRIDRIHRFITTLFEPYCVQICEHGKFSEKFDYILRIAVAIGYHLMGVAEWYRWDWTWLAPLSKNPGTLMIGEPPPRPPPEEEVPKGIWITAPALVKGTDDRGRQLSYEITCIEAKQSRLVPIVPTFGQPLDPHEQEMYDNFLADQEKGRLARGLKDMSYAQRAKPDE